MRHIDTGNLRQTLHRDIPKHWHCQELQDQCLDELCFKDVAQRNPIEEFKKSLECGTDKRGVVAVVHNVLAEGEHVTELGAHGVLEVLGLGLGHLAAREVKHLLRQQLQDDHVVLTQRLVGFTRSDDVRNKGLPVLGPLPLQDRNQYKIQFVQVGFLALHLLRVGAGLDVGYNPNERTGGLKGTTPVGTFGARFGCTNEVCIFACITITVC